MGAQFSSGWGDWTMPGQGPMLVEVVEQNDLVAESREAARGRRIAAGVFDYLVLALAGAAVYAAAPAWLDVDALMSAELIGVCAGVFFLYFVVLETMFGQTLGKAICDVRVTDRWGRAPGADRIVVRTVLRPVDVFVGLLAIHLSGHGRRQRVGDIVAGTVVVRASESEVPRRSGLSLAAIGLTFLVAPLAFVATPAAADILPRDHDYEIRQASVRYLQAVAAEDTLAACRETAEDQRRAIAAANGNVHQPTGSVPECAVNSAGLVAKYAAAYPFIAGQELEVDRRGDAAVVSTPGIDKLITLGREGDTWKVDFLATSRAKFMADCAAPPSPADAKALCGCAWAEIRAHGIATLQDMKRFNRQVLSRRTPAWVAEAVGGCQNG